MTRAALLAVAALAVAAPAEAADFRISTQDPIDAINPLGAQNEVAYDLSNLTWDLLLNYKTADSSPDLEHSLARSYDVSRDGMTWTFHLRDGIVWSDGRPCTAADVVFTYRSVMRNKTNYMKGYFTNVKSVEQVDRLTMRMRLSRADVRISSIMVFILPRHVFSRFDVKKLDSAKVPLPSVTTAPFRYAAYDKTGTTILEPNPRFRGPKPAMDRILTVKYDDREAQLRDIELGKLDLVYGGSPQWLRSVRGMPDLKGWSGPVGGFMELAFNSCPPGGAGTCSGPGGDVAVKVVQDPAIRRALAWGIDRSAIARTIYAGRNRPALGLMSPYYARYFKDWSADSEIGYRYDPARARRILADGGWDCSRRPCVKDGVKARFEVLVRATDDHDKNAVKRIRAWAADLGIEMRVSAVTVDALNNRILNAGPREDTYEPTFDAFYWNWTGDPTPDFNFEVLRTGSAWQDAFYSNPAYDRATLTALGEQDFGRRVALLQRAEKIAMTDLPYIPTVYNTAVIVTRTDTWHGWQPSSAGLPFGTNWLQMVALRPGPEPAAAVRPARDAGGPPWLLVLVVGALAGSALTLLAQRRRRGAEPLEWPEV